MYPNLDPKSLTPLRIIQAALNEDPEYLEKPECPYPPELKAFLSFLGAQKVEVSEAKGVFFGLHGDKWAILEAEAERLYKELRNSSSEIGKDDVAERMSYFRTATSLLEKIVSINERAVGLKHVHDFQQMVLQVFEENLTPDQRTSIIQKLKGTIDIEVES